jgi:PAS domain S-box-containing protein
MADIADLQGNENVEALLTAIVESSTDGIISKRLDGTITTWNASAERIFGYTRAEIVGRNIRQLIPAGRQSEEDEILARIVRGERIQQYETVRLHKSGRHLDVSVTISPMHDSRGTIFGASKIVSDITDRKAIEKKVRDSEAFTRRVLDNLYAFVGVMDLDGTLLQVNRAPLEAAGIAASDVIGRKFWECYWWSYAPEVQAQVKATYERALTGESVRYDVPVRMAGDTRVWIDFQLAPLRGDDGAIAYLIPSGMDLSGRKQAEERLRKSYQIYLSLIENAPFGVYLVDSRFQIAQISTGAEKAFETVDGVIGRHFGEVMRFLWPEAVAGEIIGRFEHTLATGEPYRSERMIEERVDTGSVESYDWTIERVTLPDGLFGVVCYFYDLSERQRHEEHVRMLMGEVNHRAKNMLSIVQAVARQTLVSSPKEFMDRFSQRLQSLAANQDLLVRNDWRGIEIEELVRSQIAPFQDRVGARISIVGPRLRVVPVAGQGIGMAIHELATNALKYGALSNEAGRVGITWVCEGDTFSMRWAERDGPPVTEPTRRGFGSTVVTGMVKANVGGEVELLYAPTGLVWSLSCPIKNLLAVPG